MTASVDPLATAAPDEAGLESAAHAPGRPPRFPLLDGYRAIAATAVVATHVGYQTGQGIHGALAPVLSRLDWGVALFFVLSGFLLYRPHVVAELTGRRPPSTPAYLWRRALRLLPAYWLVVAVVLVTLDANAGVARSGVEWARQVLLLQIYRPDHLVAGLTQVWSLCTEVTFYLALPVFGLLAARVLRGRRGDVLRGHLVLSAVLVVVAIGWRVAANAGTVGEPGITPMWLPGYLDWFALGMAAAAVNAYLATLKRGEPSRWRALDDLADAGLTCWALAAGLFWIATSPVGGPRDLSPITAWQDIAKHVLYGVTAIVFLLPGFFGDQRVGVVRRMLSTRPMQFLGEISYGIFLWHLLILRGVFLLLDEPLFAGGAWPIFLVTLAATVVVATASSRLLERPALRLRRLVPDVR
jgi:peptidoglycan/LPS O-acetylase OafA/YrhL